MSIPSGLATIAASFDDSPQVRGAVAFGRMVRENTSLQRAVDEHARLAVSPEGPSRVEAVARAIWGERVRQAAAYGVGLEQWGDGSIPRASGVMEEAEAAIEAIERHAALVIGSAYRSADRR